MAVFLDAAAMETKPPSSQRQQQDAADVAAFLSSIDASCSLSFGQPPSAEAGSKDTTSAPQLPISATVSLIDAQIDQLEGRITATIKESSGAFKKQAASSEKVRTDLDSLWNSISGITSHLNLVPSSVSPALSTYHRTLADSTKQDLLCDSLASLLEATEELERAELLLRQGQLSQLELQLENLKLVAARIGACQTDQTTQSSDLAFLANDLAVQELARRIKAIEREAASQIQQSWGKALDLDLQGAEAGTGSTIVIRWQVPIGTEAEGFMPLSELADNLSRRGTLVQLISDFAQQILQKALRPLLVSGSGVLLDAEIASLENGQVVFRILPAARGDRSKTPIEVTSELLSFLRTNFFDKLGSDHAQQQRLFTRELFPLLVPACISYLNKSIPTNTEPVDDTLKQIQQRADEARRLEKTLRSRGYAASSRAPDEDEDEDTNAFALERWAQNAGSHFSRGLARLALEKARRLILAQGGGSSAGTTSAFGSGWESEIIHVDSKLAAAQSTTSLDRSELQEAKEVEGLLELGFQPSNAAAKHGDEPGWGDFDDNSAWTNGIKSHPMSSRQVSSTGSGRSTPARDSPSSSVARRTKAKLGGVRVVRPQDQLGSGPFNEEDLSIDETSWGLDEQDETAPSSAPALAPAAAETAQRSFSGSSSRFAPQIEADANEDDPWFTQDEETEQGESASQLPADAPATQPVTLHHSYAVASLPSASVVPAASLQSDADDDPWFVDDDDAPAPALPSPTKAAAPEAAPPLPLSHKIASPPATPNVVQTSEPQSHSMQPISSTSSISSASCAAFAYQRDELEDDEDDAWGLTEEEREERRVSMMGEPASFIVPREAEKETATIVESRDETPVVPKPAKAQAHAQLVERSAPREASPAPRSVSASSSASKSRQKPSKPAAKESTITSLPAPAPAAELKESCTISKRSIELLKLANEILDDGLRLLKLESEGGSIRPSSDIVLSSVSEVFDLHRALMPVAHGQVLRDVPSLAMQFSNDCEYIAKELDRIFESRTEALAALRNQWEGETPLEKLKQQAGLTRALGQRWFDTQMAAQMRVLEDGMNEADSFVRTFDSARHARCERCVKQVIHTINQLGTAWKPVLASSSYLTAMGRLVDTVLQKMLHDIEDLEDIGETESEKLAGLVKLFGPIEELFVEPRTGQTAVALFVPSWFKASYLIEILTVDIEFLTFEAGALVDYRRKELVGLIKALFADTPKRAKLINRIETSGEGVLTG